MQRVATTGCRAIEINDHLEARGMRMERDRISMVLREGAMTLPGSIVVILLNSIAAKNAALSRVPPDWAMSHAELAAAGII